MAYSSYKAPADDVSALREKLSFNFVGGYLFWGEEDYLKRHYIRELKSKILDEGMADFNLVSVEFEKGAVLGDIAAALETPPVFASHKMVEVTGLALLDLKKDEEKRLIETVKKRADDTVLLFSFHSQELDLSSKKTRERAIIKELSQELMTVEFPRQPKGKLVSWTDKIFTSESLRIADFLIERMIELCDFSMTRLRSESEKLCARAKFENKTDVPREWIDEMVRPTAENELYELSEAVARLDTRRAVEIFENLASQNVEPVVILGAVSRTVSGLSVLYSALNSGAKVKDSYRAAGFMFEWQAERFSRLLKPRTSEGLCRSVRECFECDLAVKGNSANKLLLVERLITALTSEACR